jgi:hypothetical protein
MLSGLFLQVQCDGFNDLLEELFCVLEKPQRLILVSLIDLSGRSLLMRAKMKAHSCNRPINIRERPEKIINGGIVLRKNNVWIPVLIPNLNMRLTK